MTTKCNTKLARFATVLAVLMCFALVLPVASFAQVSSSSSSAPVLGGSAYISAYNVTDDYGAEILNVFPGTKCNVTFLVVDERIKADEGWLSTTNLAENIRIKIAAGTWSSVTGGDIRIDRKESVGGKLTYSVTFHDTVYQGPTDKNFSFDLSVVKKDASGRETSAGYAVTSLSQSIAQCSQESTSGAASAKPSVMVKDSSYGAANVNAGESFTLVLTSYNTSKTVGITDVTTTISLPTQLTLAGGSNTVLTNSVAAGASFANTFQLQAQSSAETGVVNLTVNYQFYIKGTSEPITASQLITVSIVQPDRFSFTNFEIPAEVYANEEGSITVGFVNKGKGILYNLSAEIAGNFENPGQNQYLGNLNSGTEGSADFSIKATQAGTVNGTITLTYEDINGAEKKQTKEFTLSVLEAQPIDPGMGGFPGTEQPGMDGADTAKSGMPWWAWVLIALVVIVVLIVVIKIIKKKKAKKLAFALSEDDDEDF